MTDPTQHGDTPALLASDSGFARAGNPGLRKLLRNTGLLATSLGDNGTVPDAATFRQHCRDAIQTFSEALAQHGYPEDIKREISLAQCGLLDEAALRHLSADSRGAWELKPLQVERFKVHDAGEFVIDRIEARLLEAPPNADLLEGYAAILGMGFMGRYARDSESRRVELIGALGTRLNKLRPREEPSFVSDRAGRQLSDWVHRLSPWALAGVVCVVAAIVWSMWAVALNTQASHVAPAKVAQP